MATNTSSVSTSGSLTAPGIGSGLDVKSIISQLMAVERQPLDLLAKQEATFQLKLTSLGSIKGSLATLQTAAQALVTASTPRNVAMVSESSVLLASADATSVAGKYRVEIDALAQSQKLLADGVASSSAAIGSGTATTLSFTFGSISSALGPTDGVYSDASFQASTSRSVASVSIPAGTHTLEGIRDHINAARIGVTATIINDGGASPYRLAISVDDTGLANSIKVGVSGDAAIGSLLAYDPQDGPQNLQQTQVARNATVRIDGVPISSASNTVTGAIQGVSLSLSKETVPGSPVTVTVQRDQGALTNAIKALVAAYNDGNKTLAGASAKAAVLQGDSGVVSMQLRIRAVLSGVQQASGAYTVFSQLGASFQKDGTLALDNAKLSAALAADPQAVQALGAALGAAMDSALGGLLLTDGPLAGKTQSINASISALGQRRDRIQQHIESVQANYQRQFSALDTLISNMNQTSSFLTQQLSSIANITNFNKN